MKPCEFYRICDHDFCVVYRVRERIEELKRGDEQLYQSELEKIAAGARGYFRR